MDILRIAGLALISVVLISLLRQQKPEFAVLAVLVVCTVIMTALLGHLAAVVNAFRDATAKAAVMPEFTSLILKITGVAYIADFMAQVCRDANESAVAAKVELAGKLIILGLAVPLITMVLDTIRGLLD
ncbi:MAG: SpoIIIAC/SpoIIIAD family protein [Bacillota bacterium]